LASISNDSRRLSWQPQNVRLCNGRVKFDRKLQKPWLWYVLKITFLGLPHEFFRDNLGDVREEHGERFHQDIQVMEKRYQGRWDEAMMGDYIWSLVREDSTTYKRKNLSNVHF